MTERKRQGRRVLIASIGVAAVSYVACGGDDTNVVANLISTPSLDSGKGSGGSSNTGGGSNTGGDSNTGGNGGGQAGISGAGGSDNIQDAAAEKTPDVFVIVANLMVVPTPDAKADSK